MCGRAALTSSANDLREAFGLSGAPELTPHYNIAPSQPLGVVRVVRRGETPDERRFDLLRWGLLPFWADDPKIAHKLTLARVETVLTAPAFRRAVRGRRCLVAVDGFFEWLREGKTARPRLKPGRGRSLRSRPFFVRRPDGKPFALAGVWDRWVSKDGEVIESCAILTQPANPPVAAVHDRMPLVLERADWDAWLNPMAEPIAGLLMPRSPELVAYEVSPYVNDPKHDDPACLRAAEPAQTALF